MLYLVREELLAERNKTSCLVRSLGLAVGLKGDAPKLIVSGCHYTERSLYGYVCGEQLGDQPAVQEEGIGAAINTSDLPDLFGCTCDLDFIVENSSVDLQRKYDACMKALVIEAQVDDLDTHSLIRALSVVRRKLTVNKNVRTAEPQRTHYRTIPPFPHLVEFAYYDGQRCWIITSVNFTHTFEDAGGEDTMVVGTDGRDLTPEWREPAPQIRGRRGAL